MLINILATKPPKPPPSGGCPLFIDNMLINMLMLFAPLFIGTICSTNLQSLTDTVSDRRARPSDGIARTLYCGYEQ